jgi:predicted glycogen debranching enzyme
MRISSDICTDLDAATQREWLVANGLGGYACGTIAGAMTRRYHGLLVAATNPPVERTVLLQKIEEVAIVAGARHELATNYWASGAVAPRGLQHLRQFALELGLPVWTFGVGASSLEKRLWMVHGRNAVVVRYTNLGLHPIDLQLRFLVNDRVHHALTRHQGFESTVAADGAGAIVSFSSNKLRLRADRGQMRAASEWYRDFLLPVERDRGYEHVDNALCAAQLEASLEPGASVTIVAATESIQPDDALASLETENQRRQALLAQARQPRAAEGEPLSSVQQLVLSADSFIVKRDQGASVIAGYPWFTDWGRDTMIAFRGLFIATGRVAEGEQVLRTFAAHVRDGLIPNRFADDSGEAEYNTVDATLWFMHALDAHRRGTGSLALIQELIPVVMSIVDHHVRGTRHGIRAAEDGLLEASAAGQQLTWMDARVGAWVVTPRRGKPVEINALWHSALCMIGAWRRLLGLDATGVDALAKRARDTFQRFWNARAGCCYDVVDSPDCGGGPDDSLRPNQLLAVSLPHSPLSIDQQRSVVDVVMRRLLVPGGVRTLDPIDPRYQGRYEGSQMQRDAAYHQGTAWPWLLGPLADAMAVAYGNRTAWPSLLGDTAAQLSAAGMGSIGEVLDGDSPYGPGGCPWQAWSVAEVLRLLCEPGSMETSAVRG